MSNKGVEFADLIGNIHLAEPLTVRGKKALSALKDFGFKDTLSENEFLEEIYIEPFTKFENLIPEAVNFHTDSDADPVADPKAILQYAQRVDLNILMGEKSQFENSLKRLTNSLFIVKGSAGSGKTTYLHCLKKRYQNNIGFLVSNFEETIQTIDMLGIHFDFKKKYQSNVWKFVSTILDLISRILQKNHESNYYTGEHIDFIKRIVKIYKSDIDRIGKKPSRPDDTCFVDIFEILELYTYETPCDTSYMELGKNLHNHFQDCYSAFEQEEDRHQGRQEAIKLTAGFLIRLFYCMSKINTKKYACVIDNIETFVPFDETHPIQDCELQDILDGVEAAITNIRPRLPIDIPGYQTFYGFVLLTRETTANIAQYSQFEDYSPESEIDISEWFCASDIFKKKKAYFWKKITPIVGNPYLITYEYIMNDLSCYSWGLHNLITKMYKCNYRRMVNVISALSVTPEKEIDNFNTQWKKIVDSRETDNENDKYYYLKHLCRQFILRILINHAQTKKYFDNILTEKSPLENDDQTLETLTSKASSISNSGQENISYARRVATLLHRVAISQKHMGNTDYYISFPRLVRTLMVPFNYPQQNPAESQLRDLAQILYWMNETRNDKTHWAALITIKFDSNRTYNVESLYELVKEEWDSYYSSLINQTKGSVDIDRNSPYGVCITEAGSFFAKIIAEFEYFSCRFLFREPALLAIQNLAPIRINNKNTYRGVAIISEVRERAIRCIDGAIKRDKKFFASAGSRPKSFEGIYGKGEKFSWVYKESPADKVIVHSLRVLHQHMGYVYHYIKYITDDVDIWQFQNPEDKGNFIDLATKELNSYWDKLEAITKKNPEYFNHYKPDKSTWGL